MKLYIPRQLLVAGAFALGCTGCDDARLDDGTGGSSSGGAASCEASSCPGLDEECRVRACDPSGACGFDDLGAGEACSGGVCDGQGACVACLSDDQCADTEYCEAGSCLAASCRDKQQNGLESATDCGGDCAPCEDGLPCNGPLDCKSQVCEAGICAPCGADGDCPTGSYCEAGACAVQKANGDVCAAAGECQSGQCVGGVCCDGPCAGGCESCLASETGGVNGTCAVKTQGQLCRAAAGPCDVEESCDGSSNSCPADQLEPSTTTCRAAAGPCDVSEACTGVSALCPADAKQSPSHVCRASAGSCDVAETCDGASDGCPTDQFKSSSTVCRAANGPCDVAESCTGSSASCPGNQYQASTTVCRPSNGQCDVAEYCTGLSSGCPTNSYKSQGASCSDNLFCNGADQCNGSGSCSLHAGNPCPGPDNDSDCSESCHETTNSCIGNDPNSPQQLCGWSNVFVPKYCVNGICQ